MRSTSVMMVRKYVLAGSITLLCAFVDSLQYTETVQTVYGPVRGEEISANGLHFKAFKGIPYARSPSGELRFKAPLPPDKWRSVRNATKFGPMCPQGKLFTRVHMNVPFVVRSFLANARNLIEIVLRQLTTSEDCLSINVYTTQLANQGLKPVLVIIHGGAFIIGDGTDVTYGPDFLLQKDIVMVTFNYRVGALGFLSTNTTDAPGNSGLKDQVAALKWVQENIAQFGGDPKQVTIFGLSAGAASVHLHLVSPLSKGLFQQAIVASGSFTCPWVVNDQQERLSRRLAQKLGASSTDADNPTNRVKFLMKVKGAMLGDKILEIYEEEFHDGPTSTTLPFTPVVEPPGTSGAFLTEDPSKLMAEGRFTRVPLMMGTTDLEGGVAFLGFSKFHSLKDLEKVQTDVCKFLPVPLRTAVMEKKACSEVTSQISEVYFEGKPINNSPLNFLYMFGDIFISYGVHIAQKWHARFATNDSPAYFYHNTYDGEMRFLKELTDLNLPGVIHGGELDYLFKTKLVQLPRLPPTSPGHYNQERLVSFLTNFVKYGNPTPSLSETVPIFWEPASGDELKTMRIGRDLEMTKGILTNRMDLWDSLYRKYIGTPLYT